jgi:predicted dehydrogenase
VHRFLIAGLGSIGRRHLRNLLELGVRDILLLRRQNEPVADAPDLPVFTDLAQALAAKPDAVFVCNPSPHHFAVALPAARAGCHLFIEKPLSATWDGVEELVSIVRDNKLTAAVGFDLRFDPGLRHIKELLAEEAIGRVVAVQAQVGQYLPDWRPHEDYRRGTSARAETGGGPILELIHELDYVAWLLGPVTEVACFAERVSSLEIDVEDTAAMLLRFRSGAIGTIQQDFIQRVGTRTCRIIGEQGTLVWDGFGQSVRLDRAGKEPFVFAYPEFQRNDRFREEMRHFLACLDGRAQPKVDVVQGCESLRLALAAKHSAKTGQICQLTD